MSKYEYEYDENVKLSIYHSILHNLCLILLTSYSFPIC